ncbi:PIN domain protein [Leadbettera azotonutricia ZAS-9]|uniref:PIN domain protein n=1 Tax=Leadbettera azotonutricia (strain ATCC BAA-888 / DSM 13862 / ZAS-9) TaxID=545695 RepID=F5Y9J7_LEAAZ|nr:PIN domain-containing protein [Leadbettera azotonutricia]AEF82176.1 PIN domain protein [Leadbettera azotonutricia ZAS-9]
MDFADATLVFAAEKTGIRSIISIDADFDIYRLPGKVRINNPAASREVCCSLKELDSGLNTFLTAPRGGVLTPSPRINLTSLKAGS